jgi:hypothetical protein
VSRTAVVALVAIGAVVVAGVAAALVALAASGSATPTEALGPPRFVDEAGRAGLDHRYDGPFTASVGAGLAVFDCNDDGLPELYLSGGTNPAALYRNDSTVGGPLAFTPLPDPATDLVDVNGAYPLDIEGDGRTDLVVLRLGENVLLRGLGDCRFERANEALGFDEGRGWTAAFSATWEGDASLPTLALGNYLVLDDTGRNTFDCADNALLRPDASGTGYGSPIPLTPGYCTLSVLFSDWDGSGRRDLRMTNDRHYYTGGSDQLWRVEPGRTPTLYTDADGWVRLEIWGMGIASQDLTGDGYPEIYLTSQGDNKLQTLLAGPDTPTYRDIALKRGVNAAQPFTGGDTLPSTAWHPEFTDVNNDGFTDLFVSKGNVSEQPGYATKDPSNLFIGQADGTFVEGAGEAGILSFERGRGAAVADLNLDGLPDLVEMNYLAPTRMWRNVGSGDGTEPVAMGHWLGVRPTQPGPNRDAIGAVIEVELGDLTIRRELMVGGGHAGGQLGWVHVGLGPAEGARVRVTWPDGEVGPWMQVDADQLVTIERGTNDPRPWQPPGG